MRINSPLQYVLLLAMMCKKIRIYEEMSASCQHCGYIIVILLSRKIIFDSYILSEIDIIQEVTP